MTVKQEPSGENETVARANQSTARRLHWNGDLSRDYYIAFELVNIQRKDAGDYGMRLRVDHFPPTILQNWFSLIVQVSFFRQTMERFPPPPPRHQDKNMGFLNSTLVLVSLYLGSWISA